MGSRLYSAALLTFLLLPPPARCIQHVESLKYPSLARQARIVGEIRLGVDIDADGRVQSAYEASGLPGSVPRLLLDAAVENIRKWKFSPGEAEKREITYGFTLQDRPVEPPQSEWTIDLPNRVTVVAQTFPVDIYTSPLNKKGK